MEKLNTQVVNTTYAPSNQIYQSSTSSYKMEIPSTSIQLAKPLSYEFRVVEHVNGTEVIRVGLQYRVLEHDNYGISSVLQNWVDVQRVKKDVNTGVIYE